MIGPAERSHDEGASAVEYSLIVVAIAALIAAVVFVLGDVVGTQYEQSCDAVGAQVSPTSTC